LTVDDGQSSKLGIIDDQYFVTGLAPVQAGGQVVLVPENRPYTTGLQMAVRPMVSADRRYVRVTFRAELTELVSVPVPLVPVTPRIIVADESEDGLIQRVPTPCQHAAGSVVQAAATEPAPPDRVAQTCPACATSSSRLASVLAQYERACSKGQSTKALRLAVE